MYSTSKNFIEKYKITNYPTYLFFTPEGKIAHREVGYKSADDFIAVANAATDLSNNITPC